MLRLFEKNFLRNACYVPFCFALWYALNVAYNITNKWALENVHEYVSENTSHSSALPFTIACLQFGIGSLYACAMWMLGIRRPVPHAEEISRAATTCKNYAKKFCWKTARLSKLDCLLSPRHYTSVASPTNNSPQHNNNEKHSPTNNDTSENYPPISKSFHIAIHHTLGQICTVISLSANSIGFAHVIKAMEPLFSALVSRIVLHQKMDIRVYLSLLPVVGGVVMACAGSNEFSWISFWAGMSSNAFFAMRAVASKLLMEGSNKQQRTLKSKTSVLMDNEEEFADEELDNGYEKEHSSSASTKLSAANLFAVVTCISFMLSIPLVLIVEGEILWDLIHIAAKENAEKEEHSDGNGQTLTYIITSGLFHYLNNEVMYLVLSNVHPITLAVGNTMKRVFIIVAGVLVFRTPVSLQTAVGSSIGIGGVFLYSMMKQHYGAGTSTQQIMLSDKPQLTP